MKIMVKLSLFASSGVTLNIPIYGTTYKGNPVLSDIRLGTIMGLAETLISGHINHEMHHLNIHFPRAVLPEFGNSNHSLCNLSGFSRSELSSKPP